MSILSAHAVMTCNLTHAACYDIHIHVSYVDLIALFLATSTTVVSCKASSAPVSHRLQCIGLGLQATIDVEMEAKQMEHKKEKNLFGRRHMDSGNAL